MFPAIAILIGLVLIVTGSQFLLRGGMYSDGIPTVIGGVSLILAGVWMIVTRLRRGISGQHRQGFEVLPPHDGRDDRESSN